MSIPCSAAAKDIARFPPEGFLVVVPASASGVTRWGSMSVTPQRCRADRAEELHEDLEATARDYISKECISLGAAWSLEKPCEPPKSTVSLTSHASVCPRKHSSTHTHTQTNTWISRPMRTHSHTKTHADMGWNAFLKPFSVRTLSLTELGWNPWC